MAEFQSTRPVWGATDGKMFTETTRDISIHAPRVGRDVVIGGNVVNSFQFQSTRPVWGATAYMRKYRAANYISIHAPRVGRDKRQPRKAHQPREFQSTRPVWGATFVQIIGNSSGQNFNPRAPCGARRQHARRRHL